MTTFLTSKDSASQARAPVVEQVAGWSARHRIVVVVGWLLLVAAAIVVGQRFGVTNTKDYVPGQAGQAERVLNQPGVQQPGHESVLIHARSPGRAFAADPQMRQAAKDVVTALSKLPGAAADIRSPYTTKGLTSGDSALVTFSVAGNPTNDDQAVVPALNAVAAVQARYPGLTVAEAGDASLDRATGALVSQDFRQAAVTSVPVTLVLLLLVFGALIAAGIPLLLAGTAVISAISLLPVAGHLLPIDSVTSPIVLLVGMAVGVDYSLFYLRRVREERTAGANTQDALRTAARTSGRAIVAAGLTVIGCLAGLFVAGFQAFDGIAIGTMIVVALSVLGSLTFLPALISLLGKATDKLRVPFLGRRQATARPSRLWHAVVTAVTRRPLALGGLAAVALLALATPLLGLHLADPGVDSLPASVPVVRTLDQILTAFPGGPAPAEVVVTGGNLTGPPLTSALTALNHAAAASHGVIREPITTATFSGGHVMVVSVPLAGNTADAASNSALVTLRDHILPVTLGKVPGISYAVGGSTASTFDLDHQLGVTAPLVFALVAVLAFVLLMITFRSLAIPALSILLNLLSVGAAFGLMTLVFQHGLLHGSLGFTPYGGIVPWLPLFMFVLLFGLSMDYHVFILSRIAELRRSGKSARTSIVDGISSSAGVVTSAAAIMVAVFSIFATLAEIEFKLFGVTMAAAILIDATIVRGVLLPAGLSFLGDRALLGDRAWRGPGRVSRNRSDDRKAVPPPA
ncbi:MAG: putative drug exporter of the superfamily [Trebonia sp.]|nr:putative drug exporter of the superfamily [Trebonia sp.]